MFSLDVRVIPHRSQRYDTCGDYWKDGERWHFRISDCGDLRYEFLILVHEIVEAFLCFNNLVSFDAIDRFDMQYEADRLPGDTSEPGNDPAAPYHLEHKIATKVERAVALALGVDWGEYETKIDNLQ